MLLPPIPNDAFFLIASNLNEKNIVALRLTTKALSEDLQLKDMQQQRTKIIKEQGKILFSTENFEISVENLELILKDLREFQNKLEHDFSNKNVDEIQEQRKVSLSVMKVEHERLLQAWQKDRHNELQDYAGHFGMAPDWEYDLNIAPVQVPSDAEHSLNIKVVRIKIEMVEHEYLLAEYKQNPLVDTQSLASHQEHVKAVEDNFNDVSGSYYDYSLIEKHEYQRYAALFSSEPTELKDYFRERCDADWRQQEFSIGSLEEEETDGSL